VQHHFQVVAKILDRHLVAGPEEIDGRRALLERAEAFCAGSPHFDDRADTDDNESIADALNERDARRDLSKFLLRREMGYRVEDPVYSGGIDKDFSHAEAKGLINSLDDLHQVLDDHVRTVEPIFGDPQRDTVPFDRRAIAYEIRQVSDRLAVRTPERTLERLAERQEQRRQQLEATSSDPFLDDSAIEGHGLKRKRVDRSDQDSDGDDPNGAKASRGIG
jgi:hypothetical protein